MPTKKQTSKTKKNEPTELELKVANHIMDYFLLSRDLLNSDSEEFLNQKGEDWKYREIAQDIANEMGVDWDTMTYEQNNSLMLNLLAEYWSYIEDYKDMKPILKIGFEKA